MWPHGDKDKAPAGQEGRLPATSGGLGRLREPGGLPAGLLPVSPPKEEGWTISTSPGQAGEKDPALAVRQREDLTGRRAAPTARLAPANGAQASSPAKAERPPQRHQQLRRCVQPRIGPGARVFKAGHAKESPVPALSLPCWTSPFRPGDAG